MDWSIIVKPVAEILVTVLAGYVALLVSGLIARIKSYLDAHGRSAEANVVGTFGDLLQTAIDNSAGTLKLRIEQNDLPFDWQSIKKAATAEEEAIRRKMPDTIAAVKPVSDSIAQAIIGKLGNKNIYAPPAETPAASTVASMLPIDDIADMQSKVNDKTQKLESAAQGNASSTMLEQTKNFEARVALVKPRLMKDLNLADFQASGLLGNLGWESEGLQEINERKPVSGRGGFGWGQWTADRRKAFEQWCIDNKTIVTSPEANYQFLVHELLTTENKALLAIQQTKTLQEACEVCEKMYERAGNVRMDGRLEYAARAAAI